MDWKHLLPGLAPREDLSEPFAAQSFDVERPALLNKNSVLTAAAVAARVLEILAMRGGTRIKPSAAENIRRAVGAALPEPARNLCEDEAARVLRWISEARPYAGEEAAGTNSGEAPEVEIVFEADIESRISVARFALDEHYDLELEYLDAGNDIWPRIRCTPREVTTFEDDEGRQRPLLSVESDFGDLDIPIDHIRWMMPVSSHEHRRTNPKKHKPAGKLLSFPAGDESD
ncbi:MAG: hypothetical protein ACOC9W_01885 [Persicimonas sp.]